MIILTKIYTIQTDWKTKPFYDISKEKLQRDLEKFDFIIDFDSSSAFINKADRVFDIFIPFGDDLYRLPFLKRKMEWALIPKRLYSNLIWRSRYREYPKHQRQGINNSRYLFMPKTNPEFESILGHFKINKKLKLECPAVYTSLYNRDKIKEFYKYSRRYKYFQKV